MGKKGLQLDEAAASLFAELDGIDRRRPELAVADALKNTLGSIEADEKELDVWRVLLIELLHLIGSYFKDIRLWLGAKNEKKFFDSISRNMAELRKMEGCDGTILVRYRGFAAQHQNGAGSDDYEIRFGPLRVDTHISTAVVKRMGVSVQHISGQLISAFKTLSEHGIHNFHLQLPDENPLAVKQLLTSLKILAHFFQAQKTHTQLICDINGQSRTLALVNDENHTPSANLTLMAALNHLTADAVASLVHKINHAISQNESAVYGQQASVFSAIWKIESLKKKLIKPPIEINDVKWLIIDKHQEVVSREKAQLARFVVGQYSKTPLKTSGIMQTLYGNDFNKIESEDLGKRLQNASELIATIDDSPARFEMMDEAVSNLEKRLEELKPDVMDDVTILPDSLQVTSGDARLIISDVPKKLTDLITHAKKRFAGKQKIKDMKDRQIDFDQQDYEALARDFGLSVENTKKLIRLLKACFDAQGRFRRSIFEKNIPAFSRFETKAFEVFWHYLKATPLRNDRVAFINSLQLLIARLKQPIKSLRILLADFLSDPDKLQYSDRNALMLANLLLRKYNKEKNVDIEMTPEEVLLVKEGLNHNVTRAAIDILDQDPDTLFKKMRAIRQTALQALAGKNSSGPINFPPRFLFALKKEFYIFLALIGGRSAEVILRNALEVYGDVETPFYTRRNVGLHLPLILNQLQLVVRGTGRTGRQKDLVALNKILEQQPNFKRLGKGLQHELQVKRIIELNHLSRQAITGRL